MLIEILAAGSTAPQNAFGFVEAMEQGGVIAWSVLSILTIMSVSSFYILVFETVRTEQDHEAGRRDCARLSGAQQRLKKAQQSLDKNSAYRQIVDDAIKADSDHAKLTDPVEAHGLAARIDRTVAGSD